MARDDVDRPVRVADADWPVGYADLDRSVRHATDPGAIVDRADRWASILDRFAVHVAAMPGAIAVEARGERLTYAELAARAAIFAGRIAAARTTTGEASVGICLERTVDLPAWLLATFAAGAAYVPIDPALPAMRIAQILEDARPDLIVASATLADRLPASQAAVMIADIADEDVAIAPVVSIDPTSLAYVMFTSGSTGRPKGVEIEHGGIVALLDAIAERPGFGRGDTLLAPTRLSFDLSVIDLFLPLVTGGRVVILDLEEVADPRRLMAAIRRHRPGFIQATPATWRSLVDAGWDGSVTTLLCGGEAMTRDLADRLLRCCGELWNVYGPTETTVWSTACRVDAGNGTVPIGCAIAGTSVRIMGDIMGGDGTTVVPDGDVGEIVIGGAGVARGYRGQAALTAERFVTLDNGERAYRTGDLGRVGQDGMLYCLGRRDDQVKIRGFRLELGDVECALAAHPDVAWAAARVWPDEVGEQFLAAYVVSRRSGPIPISELRAFLAERLPSYMIPTRFVPLVEMPLNANRKVDRGALPDPRRTVAVVPPSGQGHAAEQRLRAIWRDLLGVADIARDDDFFDLGGYSLITVRLLRRIEAEFGHALELSDLMRASTLAAMAALIADNPAKAPAGGSGAMLLTDGGDRPPLYWLDAGPLIRQVVRRIVPGQPVYGLNLSRQEEAALASGLVDVSSVAAAMLRLLLVAQPVGPFYIGGWCRWGIVAQELAVQLTRAGHQVALLVLLDAAVPRTAWRHGVRQALLRRLMPQRYRPPAAGEPESFSQRVEQAALKHMPGRLAADIVLLRANDGRRKDRTLGWARCTDGDIAVIVSDGNHETMVRDPHVDAIAQEIDRHLHHAQARWHHGTIDDRDAHAGERSFAGAG